MSLTQPSRDAGPPPNASSVFNPPPLLPSPALSAPRRRHFGRSGQGTLELLLLLGAVVVGFLGMLGKPLVRVITGLYEQGGSTVRAAGERIKATAPADQLSGETDAEDNDPRKKIARAFPPPQTVPGSPDIGGIGGGVGGSGTGGGGGGGGGSVGGGGGGGGGGTSPPTVPPTGTGPGGITSTTRAPTAVEAALINGAMALLTDNNITFSLYDFAFGGTISHTTAEVINRLVSSGVPVVVGTLDGALAAVFSRVNSDGTVQSPPAFLEFDQRVLSSFTSQMVATVLAHESWHVFQNVTGIMNDFTNYPRVIDIEYEAFVSGAAAWNALKGSQSEPTLDAGSACVASGEARCKEILATDFGYPSGSRRASGLNAQHVS